MPETPLNPFRDVPKDLNPKEDPFFQDFVPGYQPQEADQQSQEQPPVPTNTESGLTASKEEVEAYDNQLVMCAGIEITRKQERQINQIITNLNKDRQQNGLEPVELGKEIYLYKVEIGGKSRERLEQEIKQQSNKISDRAQSLLNSKDFTVQEQKEQNILIRLTVADLGFPKGATTDEIFNRAMELGMELCPPETGPQWRLQYQDQSMNEWVYVGMKQITESDGSPCIFGLGRDSDGLLLDYYWAELTDGWSPRDTFVFRSAILF